MPQNNRDYDVLKCKIENIESDVKELKTVVGSINKLTVCMEKMLTEMQYTRKDIGVLDDRVKSLEEFPVKKEDLASVSDRVTELEKKPIKRYESVVTNIIMIIIGIVITYVASQIGLK